MSGSIPNTHAEVMGIFTTLLKLFSNWENGFLSVTADDSGLNDEIC